MRRRDLQQRNRKDLVWYLLGTAVIQVGLAVAVDQLWPTVRDPDYADLECIVHDRQAEAPGRPLVLALGSSRTQTCLNAATLNSPSDTAAPLILNWSVAGSGPMMHEIVLTRMLRAGIRPQHVFIEIIPAGLSIRDGAPLEERYLLGERFNAAETIHLAGSYAQPYRVVYPWLRARVLPALRHQAELRDALGIDLRHGRSRYHAGRDNYGWIPRHRTSLSPEKVQQMTQNAVLDYASTLTQPELAPSAVSRLGDVLRLCQREHITVALVVPPENTTFRSFAPAVAVSHMNAVRRLAAEHAVSVIDGMSWVDDDGFYDGHHTFADGANQFTERFRREAIAPLMTPRPSWTSASPNARSGL